MALIPERSALKVAIEDAVAAYLADPTLDREWRIWTSGLRPRIKKNAADGRALVSEAYLTFNRTLGGFAGHPLQERLMDASQDLLEASLAELCSLDHPASRDWFDAWHRRLCEELISTWAPHFPIAVGQAQKWVNILLKYHAAFGSGGAYSCVREKYLDALHTPIDNVVYELLQDCEDMPEAKPDNLGWLFDASLRPRWSRIQNYRTYMSLQHHFRNLADAKGIAPCSIELAGWNPEGWG